jgi:hypothetical protein
MVHGENFKSLNSSFGRGVIESREWEFRDRSLEIFCFVGMRVLVERERGVKRAISH